MNTNFNFYLTVFLSAGAGTAFVQMLFSAIVKDFFQRRFYIFKIQHADKRECASEILELLSPKNYVEWEKENGQIQSKAYTLSDKLISIGEEETSLVLDKYVSKKFYLNGQVKKLLTSFTDKEATEDYLKVSQEVDDLQKKLVFLTKKLRK